MFEWIIVWGTGFFASLIILYLLGQIRLSGLFALVMIGVTSIGVFYSVIPSRVQYRDSASDGWYVQEPYLFNATAVWFPIDEHYPGALLGWWRLASAVNMTEPSGNVRGLYCFHLQGNVITEAYLLKVWNMTSGEWQKP